MAQSALAVLFILFSVILRLVPHTPNIAPIVGIGLYSGAYLPKKWAFVVPLLAVIAGDLILGWIPEHLFGWISVVLSVGIGFALKGKRSPFPIAGASIAGSTVFFLLSNFGVWFFSFSHGGYSRGLDGLLACYAAGVPFYRNGLMGDLLYTGILFGSTELFLKWNSRRLTVLSAVSK